MENKIKIRCLPHSDDLCLALKRYIYYVISSKNSSKSFYFIDENAIITEQVIDSFRNNFYPIVLGRKNIELNNYINYFDYHGFHLKLFFLANSAYKNELVLLCISDLAQKLELFFKGHGEQSFFEDLNWTRYYWHNGAQMFASKMISWNDFQNDFRKPALMHWNKFTQKFEQNNIYLAVLGFSAQINQIQKLSDEFQLFVDKVKKVEEQDFNDQLVEETDNNLKKIIKIDAVFNSIHEQIEEFKHEIQYSGD